MAGEDIYTRLRDFLDKMPAGFPTTPTGVELKILKKLFTPEEAELTMKLKNEPEEVPVIAGRTGMEESVLAEKLEEMAQKGLIFRVRSGDNRLYQAYQFVIGIYEFQVKHLDREFSELFEEYLPYLGTAMMSVNTRQMRVIPVESSVQSESKVATYNRVRELVEGQEIFCVSQCICRKEQGLLGNPCDRPQEMCLGFGDFAQYYIDNNMGRKIDKDEALKLLDHAEKSALVLSPVNTQKLEAICCCCSCCCPNLKYMKMMPRPADMVQAYYQAQIDPDLCTGCGDCIERCQIDAIQEGDGVSEMVDGRCIGCGLCISACSTEALSLVPQTDRDAPPLDMPDMLSRIARERAEL